MKWNHAISDFKDYLKKERLDKIKNLLKQTPYPVKQQSLFPEWWVST